MKTLHPSDPAVLAASYNAAYESFKDIRTPFWDVEAGYAPIHSAVDALLRFHGKRETLKISDIGCGFGLDMKLFPKLIRGRGYAGSVRVVGCDITPRMIEGCRTQGLDVSLRDYRGNRRGLAGAQLIWANLSLIHIPECGIRAALCDLVSLGCRGAVIGIGIKVKETYGQGMDGPGRVNAGRFTAYHPLGEFCGRVTGLGLRWLSTVEVPSTKDYTYAWLVFRKP